MWVAVAILGELPQLSTGHHNPELLNQETTLVMEDAFRLNNYDII